MMNLMYKVWYGRAPFLRFCGLIGRRELQDALMEKSIYRRFWLIDWNSQLQHGYQFFLIPRDLIMHSLREVVFHYLGAWSWILILWFWGFGILSACWCSLLSVGYPVVHLFFGYGTFFSMVFALRLGGLLVSTVILYR